MSPRILRTGTAAFRDTRSAKRVIVRGGKIVAGVFGGYGPWRATPPLRADANGYVDGEYLDEPLPMTQAELRAQYVWAMARADRKRLRPEIVAA